MAKRSGQYSEIKDVSTKDSFLVPNEDVRGVGEPYSLSGDWRKASLPLDPNRISGSYQSLTMEQIPSPIVGKYIRIPDGTVATPGLSGASETDSGLYRIAADRWGFSVNAIHEVEFNSSGLAIADLTATRVIFSGTGGQLTDDAGLTYVAASDALTVSGFLKVGTATDAAAAGDFSAGLTGEARLFYDQSIQTLSIYDSAGNEDISLDAAADSWYNGAGNFGFGTTGPDRKVDILDATNPQLRLTHTDGVAFADFRVDGSSNLLMGNVFTLYTPTPAGKVWQYRRDDAWAQLLLWCDQDGSGGHGTGESLIDLKNNAGNTLVLNSIGSGYVGTTFGINTARQARIRADTTSGFIFGTVASAPIIFITNDTPRGRWTGAGNLGIGTTDPDRLLDILDASNPQLRLTHTDGSVYSDFQTNSSGVLKVTTTGNVTEIVNGTTAQALRVYGTTTGPRYATVRHNGTFAILGETADHWLIDTSGNFLANGSTQDIGASGATQPRTLYLSTSVVIGTNPATAAAIRLANNQGLAARNAANSANMDILYTNSSNQLVVADGTVSGGVRIMNTSAGTIGVFGATPVGQGAHIVDADGTLSDITTKFNTLLARLEGWGWNAVS